MENASKALIIAGAILVAILLIGVGVLIINSTGKVTDQVGTTSDTYAVQSFNEQFTKYEGTNITASQVRTLISLINSSNAANQVTSDYQVKYVDLVLLSTPIENNATYTVKVNYDTTGYVYEVKISKNT